MIRLTCTHCKTLLTIDDAFAGGVCRCQHCGTIQTVPSHLKPKPGQKIDPAEALKQPKALYQRKSRSTTGSGLDDLADAVTSSGLTSGRLQTPPPPPPNPKPRNPAPLLIAAAVLILLLFAVVVYLLFTWPHGL